MVVTVGDTQRTAVDITVKRTDKSHRFLLRSAGNGEIDNGIDQMTRKVIKFIF
ncbi:hypothetical protein NVIRENTERO_03683 [Sodalis praecaptivus]|nr:hypothetical protein NVIRENTERO_03683 [Sodalis praecaptivus]